MKGSIFIIVELDVWTYNYMNENKDKFTQDAIDKAKLYLESKGLLSTLEKKDISNQSSITQDIRNSKQNDSFEDTVLINKMNQSNINI